MLRDEVLSGLAENPALPEELLLRLVREHGPVVARGLRRRESLPAAVLAAMLAHADPLVRAAVADNRSVDPDVRLGLLADPEPRVRLRVAEQPDLTLPAEALFLRLEWIERLQGLGLMTPEEIESQLYTETFRDRRMVRVLAGHPDPGFREFARAFAERFGETAPRKGADPEPVADVVPVPDDPAIVEVRLGHQWEQVRAEAAANPALPVGRIVALLDDPELGGRAAANPALPVSEMERLLAS